MPFTARCKRCGYIVMANKRKTLYLSMEDHDIKSHRSLDAEFLTWTIAIVSHADYFMLLKASELSSFWDAVLKRIVRYNVVDNSLK